MSRLRHGNELRISFFAFQDIITAVTGILILVTLMLTFSLHDGSEPTENQQLEKDLQSEIEKAQRLEAQNQKMQQLQLEAKTYPNAAQLQSQIEALRREAAQTRELRAHSETEIASLRARISETKPLPQLRSKVAALETEFRQLQDQLKQERTNANTLLIVPDVQTQASLKKPTAIVISADKISSQRLVAGAPIEVHPAFIETYRDILGRLNTNDTFLVLYFRPSGVKWFENFRDFARARNFEIGYDAVEENKQMVFAIP